jgi:multidrug efflux pump subunit AcrB
MFDALVKRGTLTAVVALIVCLIGMVAATRIPVQMIPDLDVRTVTVSTRWPGATPQDIEKEIIIEQEEYLRSIPSLNRMISRAASGSAEIELEFPYNIDLNETLININNALSQVPSYPLNVDQPRIYASSFSANSFMFLRVSPLQGNPRDLDMDMMRDYVDDNVRTRLEGVANISRVNVGGGAEKQVQILLDSKALAERHITVAELRSALASRNRDTSGGEIESGKRRYLLRTIGRFDDLASLEDLIVARRGDSIIKLRDVARVELDHYEITQASYVNGLPVIYLSIQRQPGSNVITIKRDVLAEMEAINRDILGPSGMVMERTADDVVYVEASVANVWTNLALGAFLASLILLLFLRSVKATLIGVAGIPVCTIAAFIALLLAGRTINVISLAGVAFAIGMTLDNSIVVLESIVQERRKGLSRFDAAVAGVRKVWAAVLASTMTTVLVFLPILFIKEEAGQLYSDIAIAIAAAVVASMITAITVIPTACARVDIDAGVGGGAERGAIVRFADWLLRGWLRATVCVVASVGASLAVAYYLMPPAEYLPEGEEPKFFATMNAPPGYNLATMHRIALEIQDELMQYVGDDPAAFKRGETKIPALEYVFLRIEPERLRIVSETVDIADIDAAMNAFTAIYERYAGMRAFATRGSIISSSDGGTRSVSLNISGPELADIFKVANAAYNRAEEVFQSPRINVDPPTLTLSQPVIEIRPKWERAAELGMSAEDLGFAVAALTDGAFAGYFYQSDEKIDVFFYSQDRFDVPVDRLGQLPVYTPQGTMVPLSTVAEVVEGVDTSIIRRIGAKRTVTLNIIPPRSVALETGVETVRNDVIGYLQRTGQVPLNVTMNLSGASDQLDATREALFGNYIVAIAIIYLVLVAVFNNWGFPFIIMTTIPLGIASGLVGLYLMNVVGGSLDAVGMMPFQQSFDMITMLGFLILMGAVVNNPILIVDRAAYNLREEGMSVRDAIVEAVSSRLRPIAMTTLTTVFGLAPLVFIPGEGTELYRGVGAIVLFGVLGSAVIALTFLPAFLYFVLRFVRVERPGSAADAAAAPAPGE